MTTQAARPLPGASFHTDKTSRYFLPNDAVERERLRAQHEAIVAFMHDQPIHAPVEEPRTILDIGCGVNASMTILLARKFPDAKIYGIDLSSIDIGDSKPSNVSFIQGNIHILIDKDPRLQRASADYIYSRFMAAGVEDWQEHIKSISALLAPGGHLELHEGIRASWRSTVTDEEISKEWRWLHLMHPGMFWPENDPTGLKFFQFRLQTSGLGDANGKVYKLAPSKEPHAQLWSRYAEELFPTSWVGPIQRLMPGAENAEKRRELEEELFETLKPREDVYFPCIVVWGRKTAE
ncbi:hypothetical protein CKM354_001136900 [Cercospora kikuchii]|uniref:Methyltransferase domain-containing protein n=1 Tax=Cercospora kikuchii TaxID=84275 RepID=A0A9P3FI88_9PEZI|nr:uncharacterized protein CKM354_001136900 [Cercospora kikuchii]GIZ48301.1 hypothetical protein CKM354_001136900 [Cercospora kikuchii]